MIFTANALLVCTCVVQVDKDTLEMLKSINLGSLPGVQLQQASGFKPFEGRGNRDRKN